MSEGSRGARWNVPILTSFLLLRCKWFIRSWCPEYLGLIPTLCTLLSGWFDNKEIFLSWQGSVREHLGLVPAQCTLLSGRFDDKEIFLSWQGIIRRLSCLRERNEWRLPRGRMECSNSHNVPTIALTMIHLLLWCSSSIRSWSPEYLGSIILCTLLSE